ncbi:MAG: glycosyltransferase family 4 protein [Candidatus Falkowbacteria bacterium]
MENLKKISNGLKILSLGLDNSILDKFSALARRVIEYGELVEKYTVIVPNKKNENFGLSENVKTYGSGGGNKIAQFIKIYNLAKKLLREEKYDVITVQDQYYLALIGLYLSKKFKVGLEIQIHGFEKYGGLRKLIAKYVLARAGAVRCVSQRLKSRLVNEFKIKEEKITVVPIFVDNSLSFQETEKRGNPIPGKLIFFTAGRLVPVKNIGLQIEAMAEAVKKYPYTELWIAGDGPEKENLKFKIYDLKLSGNVRLLGKKIKEELEEIYDQADVFMLTSNAEGWPLVIVEAANHGSPIIMTDVGSAGELIINNESGLIIPIGDKEKLVEAMLKMIEDEGLKKKIGVNAKLAASRLPGKEKILELYKKSWDKAAINKK